MVLTDDRMFDLNAIGMYKSTQPFVITLNNFYKLHFNPRETLPFDI